MSIMSFWPPSPRTKTMLDFNSGSPFWAVFFPGEHDDWLVVDLPLLKNMTSSVGDDEVPWNFQYMESHKSHVPNQPDDKPWNVIQAWGVNSLSGSFFDAPLGHTGPPMLWNSARPSGMVQGWFLKVGCVVWMKLGSSPYASRRHGYEN